MAGDSLCQDIINDEEKLWMMAKPENRAMYHLMGEEHVCERGSACDQLAA